MRRDQQRGVALVVTLILLTVITVIAVAFLAVTHRERASVTETMNTTDSEFAANAGLERAKAEIRGTILNLPTNYPNLYNSELQVSTTFPSYLSTNQHPGLTNRTGPAAPPEILNVHYDHFNDYTYFTNNTIPQWHDFYERYGANLYFDSRVPVFVNTNRGGSIGPLDFRFYLDLNRNGLFERTGFLSAFGPDGLPILDQNGVTITNFFVGDPEWIGILQYPNLHHSHTNKFIARYAYVVVPAGKILDINYVGNQARGNIDMSPGNDRSGYTRNQGVGTWELNPGSFLSDLNTNYWSGYVYDPNNPTGNGGGGFFDAVGLLRHRFLGPQDARTKGFPNANLPSADRVFGALTANLPTNSVDIYANGPFPLFGSFITGNNLNDITSQPWPGGESKQHFFRFDDFWGRTSGDFPSFQQNLQAASVQASSYDRYTYYRMLAQMGTDSIPEKDLEVVRRTDGRDEEIVNKININYQNVGIDSSGRKAAATNLMNWSALDFFSNTVRVLVRQEYPGFVTNNAMPLMIPVYTNGVSRFTNGIVTVPVFTPRLRQILQIAANLYEATTNSRYPAVYRPVYFYEPGRGDVYMTGFVEDHSGLSIWNANWVDLDVPEERASLQIAPTSLAYNIGVIIGARKGLPNFNQFKNMTTVQVSRKLEFPKLDPSQKLPYATNQQFNLAITNSAGIELWNSYTNVFLGKMAIRTFFTNGLALANSSGLRSNYYVGRTNELSITNWVGNNFVVPPGSNEMVIPPSTYVDAPPHLIDVGTNFATSLRSYTNNWWLDITNKFKCFIFSDDAQDRLVDAVGVSMKSYFDISHQLDTPTDNTGNQAANVWSKQPSGGTSLGVLAQINVGKDRNVGLYATYWSEYQNGSYNPSMVNEFAQYLGSAGTKTNMQVPFVPLRTIIKISSLQVNDPLVHYTIEDLLDEYPFYTNGVETVSRLNPEYFSLRLGQTNPVTYQPWGTRGSQTFDYDPADVNIAPLYDERIKDSLITRSDDWQFPTQKFPSVGWIARVHRGTPWQTINFKGFKQEANFAEWRKQARLAFQAENHPTNDWGLAELFTTSIHPNATKGQLSVNQTNLAAWSAVLSAAGVTALSEDQDKNPIRINYLIDPSAKTNAATGDPVFTIVDAIRRQKAASTNRQFFKLSEFLATPELTGQSPYLTPVANGVSFIPQSASSDYTRKTMLTDLDYERIPDQILSLLKVGDTRFVVYAFGQSLKPAPNLPDYASVVASGPYAGMVINYQITGEVATRSVVRVDFERELNPASTNYLKFDYRKPHAVVESFNVLPPN